MVKQGETRNFGSATGSNTVKCICASLCVALLSASCLLPASLWLLVRCPVVAVGERTQRSERGRVLQADNEHTLEIRWNGTCMHVPSVCASVPALASLVPVPVPP
jgi:hypothetical protein